MTPHATPLPIPNAPERAIWQHEVPELTAIFAAMPHRDGNIDVHYCMSAGGLVILVTLMDSSDSSPEWWWHESIFVATDRIGRLMTRLTIAHERIRQLKPDGRLDDAPSPVNVVKLDDYRGPSA